MKPDQCYRGDYRELLPDIPDKSVHLIIADYPYKVKANAYDKTWPPMDFIWPQYLASWLTTAR